MLETLERRVMFAVLDVAVGDDVERSIRFVDGDGTAVTVSIRRCAATVHFTGEGLAQISPGETS